MSSQESVNTSQAVPQPKPQERNLDTELAQLLPDMPESQRKQLAALLDSAEKPNPELKHGFLDSLQMFEALTHSDSQIKPHLPEGASKATLAKEVAKLDQGQSILEAELDFSALATVIPEENAEIIHAAIACQLAGMTKPAKLLFKLFTQRQFIDANEGYQKLHTEITKHRGHIEASSKAGKSGRDKRFEKSDKVKAFAIELYQKGDFKNPHQASQLIVSQIAEYGESVGYRFTSDYQAPRTIETWLRKYKNVGSSNKDKQIF